MRLYHSFGFIAIYLGFDTLMYMTTRASVILSLILIFIGFAISIYLYPSLPEMLASHWGIRGEVNGYMAKPLALFLMPVIAIGILLLFLFIPKIDPLGKNIESFRKKYNLFFLLLIAFLLYIHILTLVWNSGFTFDVGRAIVPAIGVLIFYIGVLIRHAKRNWFVGIRTPWTLSSDTVWEKTHMLGGSLFKIAGGIAFLGFLFTGYEFWFVIIPIVGVALFLLVYSYFIFQAERKGN